MEKTTKVLDINKVYITRNKYLDILRPFVGKNIIKVITGQRRVGKSHLMLQIMDIVKKSGKNPNIIYINKESYEFDKIKNYHDLIKYVSPLERKGMNYLFIDEVQEIEEFEKAVRSLFLTKKFDIFLTGSNSQMLSSDIAGRLSGRFIDVQVHPLSYVEFLKFHQLEKDNSSLEKYIKYGGLPYLVNLELNDDQVYGYLKGVYDTVILKDIVKRYSIRNINFLNRLIEYLSDNLGSIVSAKKISDFLKSQNINLPPNTILNYITSITGSYFINKVQRIDIAGKKIFEIGEKYYFEDLGLKHVISNFKQADINKVLENLVYSKLIESGYNVYIGQSGKTEVDFVGELGGKRIYVQVAYVISSKKVEAREFGNLLDIKDNYPKYVVTMDQMAQGNVNGIMHIHILDFLTQM